MLTPDDAGRGRRQRRNRAGGQQNTEPSPSLRLPAVDAGDLRAVAEEREFLSNVCRELQITTEAVAGQVELLTVELRHPTSYLSHIHSRLCRLSHLLSDLAELTPSGSEGLRPKTETVNLEDLFEDAASVVYTEALRRHQQLVTELPEEARSVRADPGMLRRLLVQILDYAVRTTPPGGTVKVSTRADQDSCLIGVETGGPPIDDEDLTNVFRPFAKSWIAGPAGEEALPGLALAKQLVELLGGTIWVERPAEGGNALFFTLPQ